MQKKSVKERAKMFENKNNNNPKIQPIAKIEPNIPEKPKETGREKPEEHKKEFVFDFHTNAKAKKILFLGNEQESFINTFMDIYTNKEFKNKFRHKIIYSRKKKDYDIPLSDNIDNIKIISIPFGLEKNENFIRTVLLKLSKIHLVCYTFGRNIVDLNPKQKKEIEFYKYLIHFLGLREKLVFLCDSKEDLENDEIKEFINRFNFEKNEDLYEGKEYLDKIFFINNQIIYETNMNAETEKELNILKEKMNKIREIIKKEEVMLLDKRIEFFNLLFDNDEQKAKKNFYQLQLIEQIYLIYFFGEIKIDKVKSNILTALINIIIENKHGKRLNSGTELEFKDDKNYRNIIGALSKISFSKLKTLIFTNCELYDENIISLNQLNTISLERLFLSDNKLKEINYIFNEKLINLKYLDLSNNNISNLSQFINSNLKNLEDLKLSDNNISDIECLGIPSNFNNLKYLDLSNNHIKKLKIINIKSLKYLNLLNNDINEGIKEFMENNKLYSSTLNLTFFDDSIKFKFENQLEIDFLYKLDDINYNKFLEELNLNGIEDIKIIESNIIQKNIHYNINKNDVKCNYEINNILLKIITKVEFININLLDMNDCKLVDEKLKLLDILLTTNLEILNLSNNCLQDIKIISENDKLINLKKLNLDSNEIFDVSCLSNCKLINLVELDLRKNIIENIDFLESNKNLDNLEKLNLSDNRIIKLTKINLKKIKYLYLSKNHIIDGISIFTQNINNLSHKLILEKSDNSFKFYYEENLVVKFEYYIKNDIDITQFMKDIYFSDIEYLKLKGFDNNNIKFLSNNTLKDLKVLDIKDNSLINISLFDNINFLDLKKIIVSEKDFNDNNIENLKIFPSIKVESIKITRERINVKYMNPELEINYNNFDILCHISEANIIKIDEIPNDLEIFSYDSLKNNKIPIFNNIKINSLVINYKNEKFSCEMKFKLNLIYFNASYDFNNLDLLKTSDEILSEITTIKFYNITIDKIINFVFDMIHKNLKKLEFYDCIIENDTTFEQLKNKIKNSDLKYIFDNIKFNLKNFANKYQFIVEYTEKELNKNCTIFDFIEPINFKMKLDIKDDIACDLIKNCMFKNIKTIDLSFSGINNIDFLTNNSLVNLEKLNLSNNNIEDISVFDDDKIYFHVLKFLDLRDNPIKKGLEVLKKNFFQKCSNLTLELTKRKILIQFNSPDYYLDILFNNFDAINFIIQIDIKNDIKYDLIKSDMVKNIKTIDLSYSGINNIDF